MGWSHWTNEEKVELVELVEMGYTSREIADEMGRKRKGVIRMRRLLGCYGKSGPPVQIEKRAMILDYLMEHPGCNIGEVAGYMGRTRQVVGYTIRTLAKDGLVIRLGNADQHVRYVVSRAWFNGLNKSGRLYEKYLEEVEKRVPQVCRVPRQQVPRHAEDPPQSCL